MAFRLESTTYRGGGRTYTETKIKDYDSSEEENLRLDHNDVACLGSCYFGPTKTCAQKVARVALWTGTGALIGAPMGGAGAGVLAAGGAVIGFCTIL